jgi:two-component system osmolarity sensor histidine kinase EnvZ
MKQRLFIVGMTVAGCLLLGFLSFALMERHWNHVARRLADGAARNMAAIVDLYEASSTLEDIARLSDVSLNRLGLSMTVLPAGPLPAQRPQPFFDLLGRALAEHIGANIKRPFWIDTVGRAHEVEVRIMLNQAIVRFVAPRRQVYASNSYIFLVWMTGMSVLVLAAACLAARPVLRTT